MRSLFVIFFVFFSVLVVQANRAPREFKIISRGGISTKSELLVGGQNNFERFEAFQERDIFKINADKGLRDGDIASVNTYNTLVDEGKYWDTRSIPVAYSPDLNLQALAAIEDALREYEMRTCLSFVDRTTETNYIYFEPLDGCWSYVGQIGGMQTISIGTGCESMSTVIHEIMHALGIYHEQSRTDRNDYVTIQIENITPEKEYAFDSYSYDVIDDRRVPYDYNSVMHYSDTAFTSNGQKTIITLDPAFQDVIGQRRTFSVGDVTKINRMYQCAEPLRVSYTCNFESESVCGYVQESTDDADWLRYTIGESTTVTVSPNVPNTDGTSGIDGYGSYMLFDSNADLNEVANMRAMRLKSNVPQQCLEFFYYMDLATNSPASLSVYVATIDPSTGDILQLGSPVTTLTGDHETYWNIERLTISAPAEYKLVFVANSGGQTLDVIAVDDITVLDKPCETSYFVIHDYSELLASSSTGDYVLSPIMYTDDGYAFYVTVFPAGADGSNGEYLAMYYYVAMGVNDDKLKWPFYDRNIKMSVVDQESDAQIRMNQYSHFITNDDCESCWSQPTGWTNGGWGYSQFMKTSDIIGTRHFVKHNSLMISIDVKDMSNAAPYTSKIANPEAKISSSMRLTKMDNDKDRQPILRPTYTDENSLSVSEAISIAAVTASIVFVLMIVVLVTFNFQNQKHLTQVVKAFIGAGKTPPPDYNGANFKPREGHVNFSVDIDKK